MKINKNIGILIAIVVIVAILLFGLSSFGIEIGPLLYFALLIAVGYIIIDGISNFANRLIDALAKGHAISNEEINAILEKVSE